jgi:hypothetical protein
VKRQERRNTLQFATTRITRINPIFATNPSRQADLTSNAINRTVLAPLAGADMFQNRMNGMMPNMAIPPLNTALLAASANERCSNPLTMPVQTSDIYQAAKNRAIEDHEIDKLFNAEYYDYQI